MENGDEKLVVVEYMQSENGNSKLEKDEDGVELEEEDLTVMQMVL